MKSKGLRGRTAIAVFGGSVLCAAGVAAGCDPCAWPGNADSCDPCVYMPDRPEGMAGFPAGTGGLPGACEGRRKWISYGESCTDVPSPFGTWTAASLFPDFKDGTIGKYCVYVFVEGAGSTAGTGPSPDDIEAVEKAGASASCAFVEPQQADPIAIALQDNLLDSISGERASARDSTGLLARVFVLDTAPPDAGLPRPIGASPHGVTLANLIRDVACGESYPCAVDVQTRLVMPWRLVKEANEWTPDWSEEEGGQFGRLPDVVQAIAGEIHDHRDLLAQARAGEVSPAEVPLRRFYNASFKLGDCATGDACSEDPPSSIDFAENGGPPPNDVSAVFDAYLAAACTGVIHVAAAGNSKGAGSPEGMVCPARWDKRVIPTDDMCRRLLGGESDDSPDVLGEMQDNFDWVMNAKLGDPPQEYRMFGEGDDALLSVGGVDYEGRPLVMSRSGEGSCPEAVALGIGGVGADTDAPQDLPPFLHGTSVSAAIATGSLAAQAALAGEPLPLSTILAARIVNVGDTSPVFDPRSREVSIPPWGGRARTLCGDLFTGGVGCAPPWIGQPDSLYSRQNFDLPGALRDSLDATKKKEPASYSYRIHPAPVCTAGIPHCAADGKAASCDIWPQPTEPLCFRCGMTLGLPSPEDQVSSPDDQMSSQMLTFWSKSVPAPAALDLLSAALVIENSAGETIFTAEIPVGALTSPNATDATDATDATVTFDVPADMSLAGARAWISAYTEKGVYSQQVFVFE